MHTMFPYAITIYITLIADNIEQAVSPQKISSVILVSLGGCLDLRFVSSLLAINYRLLTTSSPHVRHSKQKPFVVTSQIKEGDQPDIVYLPSNHSIKPTTFIQRSEECVVRLRT